MNNQINSMMQQVQAFAQNPMQYLLQKNMNVPQNIANSPDAIIQHLLNTGQITQQQYNAAASMARQFQIR